MSIETILALATLIVNVAMLIFQLQLNQLSLGGFVHRPIQANQNRTIFVDF